MIEFVNLVIPDDIYYHVLFHVKNRDEVCNYDKTEFLNIFDKAVENIATNINFSTYYNSARSIILSYFDKNPNINIIPKVSNMYTETLIKYYYKACSQLRLEIKSIDEYIQDL